MKPKIENVKSNFDRGANNTKLTFEDYFQNQYQERWPALKAALASPEKQVLRVNRFAFPIDPFAFLESVQESNPRFTNLKIFPDILDCWVKPENLNMQVPRTENQLLSYYVMDPASLFPAKQLQVQPGDKVLDMCAAPGGKTLILAQDLLCPQGPRNEKAHVDVAASELIANDLSQDRRERLKRVLQQYIPLPAREVIRMTGKDGGLFAKNYQNYFDKILVDAPCSGERHLMNSQGDVAEWTVKKSEHVAQRQYALLTAALICTKPGGSIVYSTCSINKMENDDVIERLQKKKGGFQILPATELPDYIEASTNGYWILPDKSGYGPIYFSILQKLPD